MSSLMNIQKGGGKSPQCQVCNDESSGFHYGVDSCEGCKGFFRRCITQGMTHKCANEEKCDITPFTRNSCQYCRLKKCFQVGMSREASRLGRRPKRLKEVGEQSRSHSTNVHIAPYPTSLQEIHRYKMAELQKLLQANGTFKSELMQAFLSAAQQSFREHSKSGGSSGQQGRVPPQTPGRVANIAPQPAPSVSSSSIPIGVPSDINLNPTDPSMQSGTPVGYGSSSLEIPCVGSPTSLLQTPSPGLPDFNFSDLQPCSPGTNLPNDIFDNKMFQQHHQGASNNMNGHTGSLYSPGSQQLNDNMPSPGSLNLDPCSPSTFMTFTPNNQMMSPDANNTDAKNNINVNNNLNNQINNQHVNNQHVNNQLVNTQHVNTTVYSTGATPNIMGGATPMPDNYKTGATPLPDNYKTGATPLPNNFKYETKDMPDNFQKQQIVLNANLMSLGSIKQEAEVVNVNIAASSTPSSLIKPEPGFSADGMIEHIDPELLINTPQNLADVERIMSEMTQAPTDDRLLLINQITDAVINAHMATTVGTRAKVTEAFERLSTTPTPDKPSSAMPDISALSVTPPMLWQKFLSSMVPEISKVVKFGKKLPGFIEVSTDDQIRLIKQGSFEVMLARHTMLIDSNTERMLDPSLSKAAPRDVIKGMGPMGEFLSEMFMIARYVNPLELTDEEMGMLGAILLICPDRKGIENVQSIRTIQQLYQQCLFWWMRSKHGGHSQDRFRRLMTLMPLFQKVNSDHANMLNNIKMKNPTDIGQFPELHKEIYFDVQSNN